MLQQETVQHWSAINSPTYERNLLCITKQWCSEGKPSNRLRQRQHKRPPKIEATQWIQRSCSLLLLLWVISVSFVSWWRGRMRGWHWGRVGGFEQQLVFLQTLVIHSVPASFSRLLLRYNRGNDTRAVTFFQSGKDFLFDIWNVFPASRWRLVVKPGAISCEDLMYHLNCVWHVYYSGSKIQSRMRNRSGLGDGGALCSQAYSHSSG